MCLRVRQHLVGESQWFDDGVSLQGQLHGSSDESEVENEAKDIFSQKKKQPVWVDEDDEDEEM